MRTYLYTLTLLFALAVPAAAQNSTVRVLFYTGVVNVNGSSKPSIGQQLGPKDELTVASGATLQLSVNGKVIKYSQPMTVRVADAVKRAGKGENAAVATTVRTLAAASSSNHDHTSQAGATRVEGGSEALDKAENSAKEDAREEADSRIREHTGLNGGLETAERLGSVFGNRNELLVILEPRSTAISNGAVRFRWLRTAGVERYVVSVKDYVGNELFHTETSDTTATWDGKDLIPEAIYSWSLSNAGDEQSRVEASFNRLSVAESAELSKASTSVQHELGDDNPALPLVLGALYADHGCHGEATRFYTSGAIATHEQSDEFMQRALEEYSGAIKLRDEEMKALYGQR
ncbi:MAG TPA: hypothetical protein VHI13_01860 [Candidatus Kapabacteria bacterium]|nr:hypothetical protein [Candidatus Kapabacteria bacterium]